MTNQKREIATELKHEQNAQKKNEKVEKKN